MRSYTPGTPITLRFARRDVKDKTEDFIIFLCINIRKQDIV